VIFADASDILPAAKLMKKSAEADFHIFKYISHLICLGCEKLRAVLTAHPTPSRKREGQI